MSKKIQNLHREQSGIVSLIMSLVLIIVISLIVLGFGSIVRRNTREALDRQLGDQAYYAAESGVNDAKDFLLTRLQNNNPYSSSLDDWNKCNVFQGNLGASPQLNSTDVQYTCLKVNTHPSHLVQSPLGVGSQTVWHIKDVSGAAITSLTFNWQNASADAGAGSPKTANCPTFGSLPPMSGWNCYFGILRVDLVAADAGPGGVPADLQDNAQTGSLYLVPSGAAMPSTVSYGIAAGSATTAPLMTPAPCDSALSSCHITLNLTTAYGSYYARLTMLYEPTDSVTLTGMAGPNPMQFLNGQAVIDATGRAQDVLRRIQTVVLLNGSGPTPPLPTDAVQSTGGICKNYFIEPGGSATNSDAPGECHWW